MRVNYPTMYDGASEQEEMRLWGRVLFLIIGFAEEKKRGGCGGLFLLHPGEAVASIIEW